MFFHELQKNINTEYRIVGQQLQKQYNRVGRVRILFLNNYPIEGESILESLIHTEDCLLQSSQAGSYRVGQTLGFLQFILPVAMYAHQACMVILDRLASHLDPAVAALIAEFGHLSDTLGGGTTISGQVGDTHRHGELRALVCKEEDAYFLKHLER